ncbi:hypothetical protein mRhiFer1_009626 [Rhinolophus ferrumequinum]|uniref:UBA domain-containing protein n=1 Tax=Rhinolophus ferrumequinum TaxID=59479 RepID=A0A7J7ZQW5_RHIFE|nr:hypothetical protein mRhiFer1_009626 [Rhinolophus ferrumequinum]
MPDPWLNTGQEEELKPYVEALSDAIDRWVIEELVKLGFRWEDVKNTLSNKIYNNNIMVAYRILQTQKPKLQYRAIKAEQQPMDHEPGQKAQESASPTAILGSSTTISESRTTSSPSSTGSNTATPKPGWGSRTATPTLSPGSSTTTLSPAPQCHPGDSLSSHSTSSSSGNPKEVKQGQRLVARR